MLVVGVILYDFNSIHWVKFSFLNKKIYLPKESAQGLNSDTVYIFPTAFSN